MAAENSILNAIVALRPLRDEVDNFFLFEEEVKTALTSIFEKNRVGQSSLKRAKMSQIPATALLEGEVKMWLKMLHRRLSPRMKARSAWTVEFKRAMSSEIFSLILQMVKKARSAYGVVHNEEKHTDIIYYNRYLIVVTFFGYIKFFWAVVYFKLPYNLMTWPCKHIKHITSSANLNHLVHKDFSYSQSSSG